MPTFIRERKRHKVTSYRLFFEDEKCSDAGYSFECDANGVPTPAAAEKSSYKRLVAGQLPGFLAPVVQTSHHAYTEPAIIRCSCRREVELSGFTNTCDCGADYNMSGQQLADRSQWGEETGESVADILSVDSLHPDDLLEGD
jgi:hypothetical protein